MPIKSVEDQAFEQMQKVINEREEIQREAEEQGWRPRRPERRKITVKPGAGFKRVMTSDMSEITGPTEVYADDPWITARIRDGDMEVVSEAGPQRPPQPTEQPVDQQPPPIPPTDPNAPPAYVPPTAPDPTQPPPPAEPQQ